MLPDSEVINVINNTLNGKNNFNLFNCILVDLDLGAKHIIKINSRKLLDAMI